MPSVRVFLGENHGPALVSSDPALVVPLQRGLDGVEKFIGPAETLIAALRQVGARQMADSIEDEFAPDHTVIVTFTADPLH